MPPTLIVAARVLFDLERLNGGAGWSHRRANDSHSTPGRSHTSGSRTAMRRAGPLQPLGYRIDELVEIIEGVA